MQLWHALYTPVWDAWLFVHVTLAGVDLIVCECVGKAESYPESDNCAMTPNFQDSLEREKLWR